MGWSIYRHSKSGQKVKVGWIPGMLASDREEALKVFHHTQAIIVVPASEFELTAEQEGTK